MATGNIHRMWNLRSRAGFEGIILTGLVIAAATCASGGGVRPLDRAAGSYLIFTAQHSTSAAEMLTSYREFPRVC